MDRKKPLLPKRSQRNRKLSLCVVVLAWSFGSCSVRRRFRLEENHKEKDDRHDTQADGDPEDAVNTRHDPTVAYVYPVARGTPPSKAHGSCSVIADIKVPGRLQAEANIVHNLNLTRRTRYSINLTPLALSGRNSSSRVRANVSMVGRQNITISFVNVAKRPFRSSWRVHISKVGRKTAMRRIR
jgi:hypothetical protein